MKCLPSKQSSTACNNNADLADGPIGPSERSTNLKNNRKFNQKLQEGKNKQT